MSLLLAAALAQQAPEERPSLAQSPENAVVELTATGRELLAMATRALSSGREDIAIRILGALVRDRDLRVRNEARFRLAMLAARDEDWSGAGTWLRAILDEEPGAQRARLELARVQAEMGDIDGARRTLRQAQAGSLPPDVARLVDRFSSALRERKPFGFSIDLAIAPDSNVNRATRSTTLGTVIGDFDLDEEARKTSGTGVKAGAEAYYRHPLSADVSLLARGGVSGNFYREGRLNDVLAVVSIGPEFDLLSGRANLLFGGQQRWFGGDRFYTSLDANMQWQKPLGRRSQLRTGLGVSRVNYRTNDLQDAFVITGFTGVERALGTRAGAGMTLGGARQIAREPAYSQVSGQITATGWREFGRSTVFLSATYLHLEADRRLALYRHRRKEDFLRFSLGATLRALQWQGWAPQIRVIYERNSSPIEVYRYDRWRGEFGVVRAF